MASGYDTMFLPTFTSNGWTVTATALRSAFCDYATNEIHLVYTATTETSTNGDKPTTFNRLNLEFTDEYWIFDTTELLTTNIRAIKDHGKEYSESILFCTTDLSQIDTDLGIG